MTTHCLRPGSRFARAAFAALLLSSLALPSWAQEARGTVVGTISDATGAVVPGAKVDVVSKAMGTKVTLTTNEAGHYQAAYLIPGQYQVVAQADGFKRFVRDGIEGLLAADDGGLARALVRLGEDRALRERIAAHNRVTVPEQAWPHVLEVVADAYREAGAVR